MTATFYVVEAGQMPILSYGRAKDLGLIQITLSAIRIQEQDTVTEQIHEAYPLLFKSIGKLLNHQVHLHIDDTIALVARPHRRIPFHLREKVEAELEELEQQHIIEHMDRPTPWVSPVVVAPKPKNLDKIRICVDMREANRAIKRERHITPTTDDIIHTLNGSVLFSKLDLNKGYHQLELAPESRQVTTFSIHVGLRRYKCLSFGVSSAAEVFQEAIRMASHDIPATLNINDDIIVFGSTVMQHDKALHAVVRRLQDRGLTLNSDKCAFKKAQLEFSGHVFSASGMKPDPKKVEAIQAAEPPANVSELRSLLGLASYCSSHIPNYATITQPLRILTHKNTPWQWGPLQDQALQKLKEQLSSTTVLSYFDPTVKTELIVDASPVGLAAVLIQRNHCDDTASRIIAYGSHALTAVEQRYSQTEREALAIVWGY